MFRELKMATAAALALAVAVVPVVLDRCAESCEGHRVAVASGPTCHHASSTATRIGHGPVSCGHDHSAVAAAIGNGRANRSVGAVVAVAAVLSATPIAPSDGREAFPESPPGSLLTLDRHSLPLRI